ncbi:MAG: MBL fold metallo-hydrolase [Candidatus Sericytochromatia bacterium]
MANPNKSLFTNVEGNFFVDSTCIDCDTCRQIAPETFIENGDYSSVYHQPTSIIETKKALQALVCCPTGSIGVKDKNDLQEALATFPLNLTENIYYCGFNSPKSFGANSFFIKEENGNWLIDSPKFLSHIVKKIEDLGGLKYIFLTHRDDIADAEKFAEKFKAKTIIHEDELNAYPKADIILKGYEEQTLIEDFLFIPVSGHTKGSTVLLYKNKYLFTGDHLCWNPKKQLLHAFRNACWYSWDIQKESMKKLQNYNFEWVLAGHGNKVNLPINVMQEKLADLINRM